jgi:F-type H+-transporting ATPase subunit delta
MSELATLARPYAVALFKRAKETDTTLVWSENLAFLSMVLSNEDILVLIDNPKINRQQLSICLLDICQGQIDAESENFLKLLVHNKRLALVSTITKLYEAYKADYEGYVDVDVETAYEFSEDTKIKFSESLEKTLGKKIHMNVSVDKSLIGGVLVRAGDRVIDRSIRCQLQHMQKTLQ